MIKRYISHKSNVIQHISEMEWECRKAVKGIATDSEYWTWLETITDADGVADYSGETGYTIVECTDENVEERLRQLSEYVNQNRGPGEALVYNIKYYASKRDAEEILDNEGKSHDPKQYVQSHFVGDDSAKDTRLLADEWEMIRAERDRLLTETDWMTCSDSPAMSDANKTYRQKLRDLPEDQKDKTKYSDITWPSKPS